MEVVTKQPIGSFGSQFNQSQAFGLRALENATSIWVKQQIIGCEEACAACCGCNFVKRYDIYDGTTGDIIFTAEESSSYCERYCVANLRSLTLSIKDKNNQEVLMMDRPFACVGCCSGCCEPGCTQTITATKPDGQVIATVNESGTWFTPVFNIVNANGDNHMKIRGNFCNCRCCWDVPFTVSSTASGEEVGVITKKWRGCGTETFSMADKFVVDFLDGQMSLDDKVALLTSTFLIDYMYFEQNGAN